MITIDELMDKVREIASAEPDFRYRTEDSMGGFCSYLGPIGGGEGSGCIIGRALVGLGVDMSGIRGLEEVQHSSGPIGELLYDRVVDVDFDEEKDYSKIVWLDLVQSRQDVGNTWSESVNYAEGYFVV